MSIRNKAILSMLLLILFICAVFFTMLYRQNQNSLQRVIDGKTEAASLVAGAILDQTRTHYELRIKNFINYKSATVKERIVRAFATRDRDALLVLSEAFYKGFQKENPHFVSMCWVMPDNRVFLRVHNPSVYSDDISHIRPDIVAVNKDRIPHSGFTQGPKGPQLGVVEPVFYQGKYFGALQFGLDVRSVMDYLEEKLELPVGIAIANELYAKTEQSQSECLASQTHTIHSTNNELLKNLVDKIDWDSTSQRVEMEKHPYVLHKVLPLRDYLGEHYGCLFIGIDIFEITSNVTRSTILFIVLSLLLLFVSCLILYFSFGSLIEKIVGLNRTLEKSNLELEERVDERTRELVEETEERKKAEENLHRAEKMEAIGLMASGVAHDLNNILSGVISYPELLLMRLPEDSDLRRPIAAIKESGLRAAAVVEDLLTVARDAAKVRTLADINTLVLEYLQSPEIKTLQKMNPDVVFETELGANIPKIYCSPTHVNKCLMNLVVNASEAVSGRGHINIGSHLVSLLESSAAAVSLPQGDYVAVTVEDSGSGISEEDLSHIFEPFYTKKTMGRSGTGIGLAVVWSCMEDHGGQVTVQSDDQRGTVFTLFFPVSDGEDENIIGVSEAQGNPSHGNGEVILVVDDESSQRDIAVQILTELGYQAKSVNAGDSAIAFVREHPVDLLVLDMMMEPGLDGCQTYTEILEIHPEQKAVVVSGYAKSERVQKTLDLGAAVFLKKPYTIDQLGAAVRKTLQEKNKS